MSTWCELDERQCDSVLCKDGTKAGCAKRSMTNRCDVRGCCAEAKYHPRLLYYPDNGEGHNARPAPITLTAKVCAACRASFDVMPRQQQMKAWAEPVDNLAKNLIVADGREPPDFGLTRLVWVPYGTLRVEGEGILQAAREKSGIIKPT